MAFSFGNTAQPAFGSNTSKPTGFGAPFGVAATAPTTTANTGFGFGSTFGQTTQQPAFGTQTPIAAAAPQPQQQSAFGSASFGTFGSTPATSAPAFGTAFGTPAAATAQTATTPGFGASFGGGGGGSSNLFGAQTAKPSLFGTPTTTTSLFPSSATNTPGLFGGGGGGGTTTTSTQAPSLFGNLGASSTTTTPTPSLFGSTAVAAATTTPNLFGSSFGTAATATTTPSLFGSTTTTAGGFGLFGGSTTTTTATAPSLFGGFGTTQTGGTGFGNFGGFGSTTTQQQQQQPAGGLSNLFTKPQQTSLSPQIVQKLENEKVIVSIYSINIFNDERDDILKKWNMLQACWGTGKGYFCTTVPPVEYTVYNPFYRFKAVGYNVIPEHDNAEGLVKLIFNRKYTELSDQKQVLINGIGGILGNKPNLKVLIQNIKAITDTQTEVRIVVTEKGVTGNSRKILATDLANYLNQSQQKQQLTNVGCITIVPLVTPSKATIEEYLRTIPLGFDPQMWKAAIADNPNPNKYMPVPIYGFNDLKARKLKQEYETGLHKAFEEKINNEIDELKKKHAESVARINEFRQRLLQLQHRTLRILVRQESIRKAGLAIQTEEEYLKGKLESMYTNLNVPTQFKGQLNELISTVKVMESTSKPIQPQYKLVPESQAELKEFLQLQQNGIAKLVDIVKDDIKALNIIMEGLKEKRNPY